MSLNSANIDLVAEKRELDAFLSKCLEIEIRADAPVLAPQPQESVRLDPGPFEGERPIPEEPDLNPEPEEIPSPVAEEVSPMQASAGKEEIPAGKGAAMESMPEAESPACPQDSADIRAEEIKPISIPEVKAEALQPEPEFPRTQVGPGAEADEKSLKPADKEIPEPPQATLPLEKPDIDFDVPEMPQARIPAEMRSPYLQDKSSLRKPSKNAGAMAYSRESGKKKKRLLVAVGIFIAFLIGVAVYLYMFPMENSTTEIISGKPGVSKNIQEPLKADDPKTDSKPEESKQIHKKITRGGT